MINRSSTHASKVMRDFKTLDRLDYWSVVEFCERRRAEIQELPFKESFFIETCYCDAMLEIAYYEPLIPLADKIIEQSIFNNIQYYQGEDIFIKTLYQKAQATFHLGEYITSQHILHELIKLQPDNKEYTKLLRKCLLKAEHSIVKRLQIFGILLFLITIGLVVINILFIQSFLPDYTNLFNIISYLGIGTGISLFIIGYGIMNYRVYRQMKAFVEV